MTEKQHESKSDPYATLGITSGATSAQVRAAYLQQVREHPPERDPEGFKRVREAYDALRSPRKRAELTLLELRGGPAEFDLERLHDAPPPPFPDRYQEHLLAVLIADLDSNIDAEVARSQVASIQAAGVADSQGGE